MPDNLFFQINSSSLAHYLVSACLRPTQYIENRDRDFQNKVPSHLIFSKKKWSKEGDCSIEVVLNQEEQKNGKWVGRDYFLYPNFIPISRISRIFFNDKERKDTIKWNIENGAGFIPERWVRVEQKNPEEIAEEFNGKELVESTEDLSIKLKQYNKLLGGLAFMRTAIESFDDPFINYPINYISTLSYFNPVFTEEWKGKDKSMSSKFTDIFKGEAPIYKFLARRIDFETVERTAKNENISLHKKFGNLSLENVPKNSLTYKLAVLFNYGDSSAKKPEDLLTNLMPDLQEEKREELALIFGLYTGYKSLRNYYKIKNKDLHVKFEMASNLDFYIIESIFQYISNKEHKVSEYNYLNKVIPGSRVQKVPFNYQSYISCSTTIVTKEEDYNQYWSKLLKKLNTEILNWFPGNLFKVEEEVLNKRLSLLLKPLFTQMIKEIQLEVQSRLEATQQSDIENKRKQKIENEGNEIENHRSIEDGISNPINLTLEKSDVESSNSIEDDHRKYGANVDFLRKESSDIPLQKENHIAQEKAFDSVEENKPDKKSRSQLEGMRVKDLKNYAKEENIQIPSKISKKEDIITFILSNPGLY